VLTHEHGEFIESVIRAGEYQNADEVVRDALRMLQHRRQKDALRLEALRTLIQAGAKALEGGILPKWMTPILTGSWQRYLAC
jgi:antitoxin ParD1/3/4